MTDRVQSTSFGDLSADITRFVSERDWDQFHSPKNLAMALSVEAAEVLEHFQWLSEKESSELGPEQTEVVAKELADVQNYLMMLADRLGVDVLAMTASKLEENKLNYPADRVRGSAKKYTEYDTNADVGT